MDKKSKEQPFPLNALPNELKVEILKYLSRDDLRNMRLLSTGWKNFVDDSGLVEFYVEVNGYKVNTFKKMTRETMPRIKSLCASDLKDSLVPIRPELKKVLLTTEELTFGSAIAMGSTISFSSPDSNPFHAENFRAIIQACRNIKQLEFGVEVLNEVIEDVPVMLKNVRLEILSSIAFTFDSDTDTTLLLGLLQVQAPSLETFSATRVLICYCSQCSPHFGKCIYLGIWKFIARHSESLKNLELHNIGSYDMRSELLPKGATLRRRAFDQHENTVLNYYARIDKFQQLEGKFDITKIPELDADELFIVEGIRKLKLKSLMIHHKVGDGKAHDIRFLKELFKTQSQLQILHYQISPLALRELILETIILNQNSLIELQIEIPCGATVHAMFERKYYEHLTRLEVLKLGGHIAIEDYSTLPRSIRLLTIDSPELKVRDYHGICKQLVNLEVFTLRRERRQGPPEEHYTFEPIFRKMLASLPKLRFFDVGLNVLGTEAQSIRQFCTTIPNISWTRQTHWFTVSRSYYEANILILIHR